LRFTFYESLQAQCSKQEYKFVYKILYHIYSQSKKNDKKLITEYLPFPTVFNQAGELAIWGTSRPRIDELIWTNPVQPVCEKWDDVWATPSCQSLADPAHRFRVERTLRRQW